MLLVFTPYVAISTNILFSSDFNEKESIDDAATKLALIAPGGIHSTSQFQGLIQMHDNYKRNVSIS